MQIFTMEPKDTDFDNAEFISAPERSIEFEHYLESWFENNPWILLQGEDVLWIGKRVSAPFGDSTIFPDLLGVDSAGNLIIVELKRNRTPRDTVVQILEYAAWASDISETKIREIAMGYFATCDGCQEDTFDGIFRNLFDIPETGGVPPLNRNLRLFIVAGRISNKILKVCKFLGNSIDISCIEASLFQTESGYTIVGMETKLGNENTMTSPISPIEQAPMDPLLKWQITWQAIMELTNGNPSEEFATVAVKDAVLREHPGFNESTISGNIHAFRQIRHIVSEAIQGLRNENPSIEPTPENIMEVASEVNSGFSQPRIRKMIDIFFESGSVQIQPNQTEQGKKSNLVNRSG